MTDLNHDGASAGCAAAAWKDQHFSEEGAAPPWGWPDALPPGFRPPPGLARPPGCLDDLFPLPLLDQQEADFGGSGRARTGQRRRCIRRDVLSDVNDSLMGLNALYGCERSSVSVPNEAQRLKNREEARDAFVNLLGNLQDFLNRHELLNTKIDRAHGDICKWLTHTG